MTNNDKSQILPCMVGTDRRQTGAAKATWFAQVLVEPHAALNGCKKSHLGEGTVVFASRPATDSFSLEGWENISMWGIDSTHLTRLEHSSSIK
jgi:hypothetical protein